MEADLATAHGCAAAFERAAIRPIDEVWHFAANSDIPAGVRDPSVDLRDTFLTTFESLRAVAKHQIQTYHFASSSAVYGDWQGTPLSENLGPLRPISNYGAMKLASEAQICASAEAFLARANIFRFPNVVGVPATHGVIFDFISRLAKQPERLEVLGNGTQQKSYLHVSDLVSAMLAIADRRDGPKAEIVNIGAVDAGVTVRWIAEAVVARVSPRAQIVFGEGDRGWLGDVPRFQYDTRRVQQYGWSPALDSRGAVLQAIDDIARSFQL
jgi:UDP-glucose 4-epimerase